MDARQLVVDASHALAAAGQGDLVWGHVSVRDDEGRGIWIKAPGQGLEEVEVDTVQLVSFAGGVTIAASAAPASPSALSPQAHKECHLHLAIQQRDPTLHCVVHTHAAAAVAFAALGVPLLPLSHDGAIFAGADVPRFTVTGGLISTPALGRLLADTLGSSPAALLPNHGLVAVGPSVAGAVMVAVLLERACRTQLAAMAAGTIRVHSSAAEALAKRSECWPESQLQAGWDYLVRRSRTSHRA